MDWGWLALALIGAVFVWARVAQVRRDTAERAQAQERHRRQIAQDPQNVGAHEALGDSLRAGGRLPEAQAAYLGAVQAAADGPISQRIEYKLCQINLDIREHAARRAGRGKAAPDLFFCRQCGGANDPTRRVCENCGGTLPYDKYGDALRDKEVLLASAEALACLVVLIAALAVAVAQPIEVKGVLIISTTIVVAWRLLQAVTGQKG